MAKIDMSPHACVCDVAHMVQVQLECECSIDSFWPMKEEEEMMSFTSQCGVLAVQTLPNLVFYDALSPQP